MQGRAFQAVVDPMVPPIVLRHPPRRVLVRLETFEPVALPVLVQIQPDLEHQCVVVRQGFLKMANTLQIPVQGLQVFFAPRLLGQRLRVPGAGVNADLPLRRQAAPKPPQKRPPPLLLGRLLKRKGLHPARIEPATQGVQHLPASRPGHARHDEQYLERLLLQLDLQSDQLLPQLGDARLVNLLRDSRRLGRLQPDRSAHLRRRRLHHGIHGLGRGDRLFRDWHERRGRKQTQRKDQTRRAEG